MSSTRRTRAPVKVNKDRTSDLKYDDVYAAMKTHSSAIESQAMKLISLDETTSDLSSSLAVLSSTTASTKAAQVSRVSWLYELAM